MTRPMFRNVELYNYGNLSLAIYFLNKNRCMEFRLRKFYERYEVDKL